MKDFWHELIEFEEPENRTGSYDLIDGFKKKPLLCRPSATNKGNSIFHLLRPFGHTYCYMYDRCKFGFKDFRFQSSKSQ